MLRYALALALSLSAVTFGGSAVSAQDKKEEKAKTLEGKLVCSKCKLSETDKCGNALVVKDGNKEITYYLADKGDGETYHKCSGETDAKVTGKVTEKDGKKVITDAKVEKK